MGADAFVAYYGVKHIITEEQDLERLEQQTHPLVRAAQKVGLEYWWGVTPDDEQSYTLLIGIELATLGVEHDHTAAMRDADLLALMADVRQRLHVAQLPETPQLYLQLEIDQ